MHILLSISAQNNICTFLELCAVEKDNLIQIMLQLFSVIGGTKLEGHSNKIEDLDCLKREATSTKAFNKAA